MRKKKILRRSNSQNVPPEISSSARSFGLGLVSNKSTTHNLCLQNPVDLTQVVSENLMIGLHR